MIIPEHVTVKTVRAQTLVEVRVLCSSVHVLSAEHRYFVQHFVLVLHLLVRYYIEVNVIWVRYQVIWSLVDLGEVLSYRLINGTLLIDDLCFTLVILYYHPGYYRVVSFDSHYLEGQLVELFHSVLILQLGEILDVFNLIELSSYGQFLKFLLSLSSGSVLHRLSH